MSDPVKPTLNLDRFVAEYLFLWDRYCLNSTKKQQIEILAEIKAMERTPEYAELVRLEDERI